MIAFRTLYLRRLDFKTYTDLEDIFLLMLVAAAT